MNMPRGSTKSRLPPLIWFKVTTSQKLYFRVGYSPDYHLLFDHDDELNFAIREFSLFYLYQRKSCQ